MRILLTETRADHSGTADAIEAAGHEVVRCHDEGAAAFPCRGLATGDCPLDGHVDVALAVRPDDADTPTGAELGVTCALRRHLPLVVAGPSGPFEGWVTSRPTGEGDSALLDALEQAVGGGLAAHAEVALDAVRDDLGDDAQASVTRKGDGVAVLIRTGVPLEPRQREALGVRVAGAIRRFDPWTAVIDVAVEE